MAPYKFSVPDPKNENDETNPRGSRAANGAYFCTSDWEPTKTGPSVWWSPDSSEVTAPSHPC